MRSKKSEKHEKGEIASTIVPVPKNNSKPLIFRVLFRAFVKSNRATNGRSRRTIRYWLHSHIKRLKYDKSTDMKAEECLFFLFRECLAIQQAKGKCVGFLCVCYWALLQQFRALPHMFFCASVYNFCATAKNTCATAKYTCATAQSVCGTAR